MGPAWRSWTPRGAVIWEEQGSRPESEREDLLREDWAIVWVHYPWWVSLGLDHQRRGLCRLTGFLESLPSPWVKCRYLSYTREFLSRKIWADSIYFVQKDSVSLQQGSVSFNLHRRTATPGLRLESCGNTDNLCTLAPHLIHSFACFSSYSTRKLSSDKTKPDRQENPKQTKPSCPSPHRALWTFALPLWQHPRQRRLQSLQGTTNRFLHNAIWDDTSAC